jgi:hypothetical protein
MLPASPMLHKQHLRRAGIVGLAGFENIVLTSLLATFGKMTCQIFVCIMYHQTLTLT